MKVALQNLTKKFPSRNRKVSDEVVAVNDFTFEIPDGKLVGLLGPSGCGKSTLLFMICGLQKPTAGKIFFGEDDVTESATGESRRGYCISKLCTVSPYDCETEHYFPTAEL